MVNILRYTRPNHSGDGAIDSPDRFEDVFDPLCTQKVFENFFTAHIVKVRPQNLTENGLFWALVGILVQFP